MFAKKALAPKEKEPFFRFEKAAFRRIGVILRLIAIPVAIVGIILAIVLPTVSIEYANYSGSTTFPGDRADAFVPELIPGYLALFGGDYFYYYLKFKDGPVVLHTALAQTDWVLILVFIVTILTMALTVMVTFSKKMEKWSKVVTLFYFLSGVAVLASPVFFMIANSFGNTGAVATSDYAHYIIYDSLYVHSAYGAVVSFFVFVVSAVLFSVGTNFEMGGGDNRNAQE